MKLTNPELIVKRSYKEVYKDGDKIVKIFEKITRSQPFLMRH